MKYPRYFLGVLAVIFCFLTLLSIILIFAETFKLKWDCSKSGLLHFIGYFYDFKALYASTIAIVSVYYWLYQIENTRKTNIRLEYESVEKELQATLAISKDFYTNLLPLIFGTIEKINAIDDTLFKHEWECTDFLGETILEKNFNWVIDYVAAKTQIEKDIRILCFSLESFASNILRSKIDKDEAYNLLAVSYCLQIQTLYPFISIQRNKQTSLFLNIIALYMIWGSEILTKEHDNDPSNFASIE